MTMKRILHCTLMLMVLVTSGCWSSPDESTSTPNANSSPTPQLANKINSQSATSKPKDEVKEAVQKKGTEDTLETDRQQSRNGTSKTRGGSDSQKINERGEDGQNNAKRDRGTEAEGVDNRNQFAITTPSPSPSATQPPVTVQAGTDLGLRSILILSAEIIIGLLAVVLLATAVSYLWKRAWKTVEFNLARMVTAHLAVAREAQPDYAPKFSSLSSAQAEMSSRLNDLENEVRSLSRVVRESLAIRRADRNPSYGGDGYQSSVQDTPPKDEPEFPVSAVDYLGKMNRFANVVRPDFQNGILVNDPDGEGELMLIRDSRDETQPLFVVPRATQFQTKQDFYTYYQKYYDCVRPSAGDVWILGPAVVERVAGGWQLREKGMLEIR
jgi:hypothetical protein